MAWTSSGEGRRLVASGRYAWPKMMRVRRKRRLFPSTYTGTNCAPERMPMTIRHLGGPDPLVLHPGSLREYQQVVPALDSLQGGFHRLDVPLAPVNREGAQLPQYPVKDLVAEQLLLGHDVEPVVHRNLQRHQHRVPVAVVVGTQQGAVLRQVLPPDDGDRVEDVRHQSCR